MWLSHRPDRLSRCVVFAESRSVRRDSGGTQEEASVLGVHVLHHILDGRYKKRKQVTLHGKGGRGTCIREEAF